MLAPMTLTLIPLGAREKNVSYQAAGYSIVTAAYKGR